MTRHSTPLVGTLLALVLILLTVAPAAAYGNVNPSHLRLSRLDALACGTPIGIRATLTDRKGHPVSGATIQFAIEKGEPGDALAPTQAVTGAQGTAVTYLTLVCVTGTHHVQIVANGPDGAKARINLVLHKNGQGLADAVPSEANSSDTVGTPLPALFASPDSASAFWQSLWWLLSIAAIGQR